jgi:hypothetical protein
MTQFPHFLPHIVELCFVYLIYSYDPQFLNGTGMGKYCYEVYGSVANNNGFWIG